MIARVVVGLLLVTAIGACQPQPRVSTPDILIAGDFPLSEPGADVSLDHAIAYAVRQKGSVDGLTLGYWSLDDTLGPEASQLRGRENLQRIVARRSVLGVVGPFGSQVALVEIPVANAVSLAMVSPTNTASCLTLPDPSCHTAQGSLRPIAPNNYFRIAPRDPLQGRAIGRYAATKLGRLRVAVFTEFEDGELYIQQLNDELSKYGGRVVYQEDIAVGTDDFTTFLNDARARGADAVYALAGAEDNACKVVPQMKQLLPGAILLATDGIAFGDQCTKDIGPAMEEGIVASAPFVDATLSLDPNVKATVKSYRKEYPTDTDNAHYTFAAYDAARILIDAIDRAIRSNNGAVPSRPQVVAELAQTNGFLGLTGTYSFDANGDAITPMMSIYTFHDSKWELAPT